MQSESSKPLSVNVRTPPGFTSTLVFSKDNPSATVISELIPPSTSAPPFPVPYSKEDYSGLTPRPAANPIYSVKTDRSLDFSKARGGVITVSEIRTFSAFGGEGELVATWEWKEYASDIVAMRSRGMEKEPLSNWLKKGFIVFSSTAKFKDHLERTYKWDQEGPKEQLQLFALDISSTVPIAFFQRGQPYVTDMNPEPLPAMLHLAPRAEEIREDVVLSFLFMEKNRRVKDHTLNMAANSAAYGAAWDAATSGF